MAKKRVEILATGLIHGFRPNVDDGGFSEVIVTPGTRGFLASMGGDGHVATWDEGLVVDVDSEEHDVVRSVCVQSSQGGVIVFVATRDVADDPVADTIRALDEDLDDEAVEWVADDPMDDDEDEEIDDDPEGDGLPEGWEKTPKSYTKLGYEYNHRDGWNVAAYYLDGHDGSRFVFFRPDGEVGHPGTYPTPELALAACQAEINQRRRDGNIRAFL